MIKSKLFKTLALTLAISSVCALAPSTLTKVYAEEQTGWVQNDGYWFYLNKGTKQTGWIYDSGNWYYCWSNGQMATDTTIGGYYVNSSGAWTTSKSSDSSDNALKPQDADGKHYRRTDISQSQNDLNASNQLTTYNSVSMSSDGLRRMQVLSINLAQGKTTIDEARSNCIGKVVDGYKIIDIKIFDQSFLVTTGTDSNQKVKAIEKSSLVNYKSSSSYNYDEFLVFSCGNARASEWEAIRVVVEFEVV